MKKYFENIKLASTFNKVSLSLDLISKGIKIFALSLMIFQAVLIFKEMIANKSS